MLSRLLIFKNIISNLFYQLINILFNFILTPIILAKFGSDVNGLVQTIRQILNYAALVGSGISESTVVALYKPIAENDQKKINSIMNACNRVFFSTGYIFSILALIISVIYPLLVKGSLDYYSSSILILVLGISGASEFFVIGKYRALLIADQRIYIVNIIQSFALILGLILAYILIRNDFNIIVVQLGVSLSFVLRVVILGAYINKCYPFLDRSIDKDMEALSKRKSATIHQLAGIISFGSQITIISIFCGNKDASIYSVYLLVFNGLGMLLSTISSALIGTFGNILARKNTFLVNKGFRFYESIFYTLGFSSYITAFLLMDSFLKLYLNTVKDMPDYIRPSTILLFSLLGLVNSLRTPAATIINAAGHYKETQRSAIIEMIICFLGQLILVSFYGIDGVIFASLVSYLYRFIDVDRYINLNILQNNQLMNLFRIVLCFALSYFVVFLVKDNLIEIVNYIHFFIYGVLFFTISFILFFCLNFLFYKITIKELKDYVIQN